MRRASTAWTTSQVNATAAATLPRLQCWYMLGTAGKSHCAMSSAAGAQCFLSQMLSDAPTLAAALYNGICPGAADDAVNH
jgi:hypothetical protein